MSITALRTAVTNAGGTPTKHSHVGLLRELISAWGGTPTKYSVNELLVQAIATAGGASSKALFVPLLRDLVGTLGGTPQSFIPDALVEQIASLAGSVSGSLSAPVLTRTTADGANPMEWDSDFDGFISWDSSTSSGDKHRMRWRLSGGAWNTEVYQELDDELLSGGFTWPLWEAAKPFAAVLVEVQEQRSRWVSGVMTAESPWSTTISDTMAAIDPWVPGDYFTGAVAGAYYDVSVIGSLWQDSARTTPVTASGDPVGAIDDLSGNGNHLTQSTAGNRPTYRTNGGAGGDKPYLDFDGTNDRMVTASFTGVAQPHFQSIAIKNDSITGSRPWTDGILSSNRASMLNNGADFTLNAGAADRDTLHDVDATSDVVVGGLFNGASSLGYKDGTASGALASPGTHTITGICLGSGAGAGAFADGRFFAGFFAIGNAPDATARANILTWLGSKQGRTL